MYHSLSLCDLLLGILETRGASSSAHTLSARIGPSVASSPTLCAAIRPQGPDSTSSWPPTQGLGPRAQCCPVVPGLGPGAWHPLTWPCMLGSGAQSNVQGPGLPTVWKFSSRGEVSLFPCRQICRPMGRKLSGWGLSISDLQKGLVNLIFQNFLQTSFRENQSTHESL
uniref:Uncharacterized protein n=1 Tax=Crocodylus porosus TaxID=8502 RepID=A0A7M4F882_CROPO